MFSPYRSLLYLFQFTTSQGGRQAFLELIESLQGLSIHDLTRRSTSVCIHRGSRHYTFNSRPHKEVDMQSTDTTVTLQPFQFTTSQGGRQPQAGNPEAEEDLAIHDLTRRSTTPGHQLRGEIFSFNSRPHKEVDKSRLEWMRDRHSFNSRPHKEVDGRSGAINPYFSPFNSRPHKEVDMRLREVNMKKLNFQFTTSQGGRLSERDKLDQRQELSIHDLTRRSTGGYTWSCGHNCLSIHDLTRRSTG